MFGKAAKALSGTKMTIVSGGFLACSLALLIYKNVTGADIYPWLDPALVTVAISGYPLLYLAVTRLVRQRWVSSALLIVVAMVASLCMAEVFAAGEVAFIMALGSILEEKTTERAGKGLRKLAGLMPRTGRVLTESGERVIPASEIERGMTLRVLAGEVIPADGRVTAGETSVDQSVLTGESLPVDKAAGDEVFCGTLNQYGSVDVEVTGAGADSSLSRMIGLLRDAENKKAPMQRIADKWATWLVPVAIVIAAATGTITWLTVGNADNAALVRAVTVLVVFCPCALVLATPTAIMAGIGQATSRGVLIRSGEAMESMGKATCIAFDKTGTLTVGRPSVTDVRAFGCTEEELIAVASAVERRSEHPLGRAITAYADALGLPARTAEDFSMSAGGGASGRTESGTYRCGTLRYLGGWGVTASDECLKAADELRAAGKAAVFVADERAVVGVIGLADTLRPNAARTVSRLKAAGYRVVLLTGDHSATAAYVARLTGIDEVHAELLPQDKVAAVARLQSEGETVCMVGDGVNDAPALKTANVGVAMSETGSDIAAEAAGISLTGEDVEKLLYLCRLSRATLRTIRLGIALSMTINAVAIALSSLGLLTPVTGAIVHNAGSVLVVLIAALLYDRKFDSPPRPRSRRARKRANA